MGFWVMGRTTPESADFSELPGLTLTWTQTEYLSDETPQEVRWINRTEKALTYGLRFSLEKLVDGCWRKVSPYPDMGFFSVGFCMGPGEEWTQPCDVAFHYPPLTPGQYRLLASCSENNGDDGMGRNRAYRVAAGFTVNDSPDVRRVWYSVCGENASNPAPLPIFVMAQMENLQRQKPPQVLHFVLS